MWSPCFKKYTKLYDSVLSSFLQIKCATENDEINLAWLIRTNDDYIVETNDAEFHINVCNPLVTTANLTTCRGSSACMIQNRGDTQGIVSVAIFSFNVQYPLLNQT